MHKLSLAVSLAAAHALLAAPALALAECGPVETDFSVPSPLPAVPVSVDLADDRVLLGKRGERVPTNRKLAWTHERGDLNPQTWADKVDWSAYRARETPGTAAPTRLYFDPAGKLCRIERYGKIRGRTLLESGYTLAYDAAGALAAYTEYDLAGASSALPYAATRRVCLQRNAQGVLTTFIDDRCGDAKGPGASRHYLHDASGRLLRVVDTLSPGQPLAVQTFDAQGKPAQRYVRQPSALIAPGDSQGLFAYPEPAVRPDRLYPRQREQMAAMPGEIPGVEWRIVRIPDDVPMDGDDQSSWDPALQTVLAKGETDAQGAANLTPQAQEQIWQAMHAHPGRVLFYFDPMGRVALLPAMTPAQWTACGDPANLAPDACTK
ncbi:hypothetical protein [Achromobacter sp. UMC46]|uniref:hypothetical protein n=1 Tax=Achromobacter sp. UMC46 TaxID=1862319 RepID=UPI0016011C94|nr:hypothetical protein [Achromobacter sp. UMC46]MBB1592617.1 hypothetical protein [Achromobacter sp. UMC46]